MGRGARRPPAREEPPGPPGYAALAVAAYSLQLYFDFSGYSDMAIGLGRMLGFRFKENFLWPYAAASIREFWRRWHVSLSSWLRDYLYIPLGGSRRGTARACLNGLVVFTLCGVWHGTGPMFALWGLWHGALLCAERLLGPARAKGAPPPRRPPAAAAARFLAAHAYALAAVAFGWVLFRSPTPAAAGTVLLSLAGLAEPAPFARALVVELSPLFWLALAAAAAGATPLVPVLRRAARRVLPEGAAWALLASGTHRSFLYFQF